MRHAELRLVSQAATIQAFEARATSILGWVLAILTTITGAALVALNSNQPIIAVALYAAFLPAIGAVVQAVKIIWPKPWGVPGYDPAVVTSECVNELQQIEFLVSGYSTAINENARHLNLAGKRVRQAWLWLMATPLAAAVASIIASAAAP